MKKRFYLLLALLVLLAASLGCSLFSVPADNLEPAVTVPVQEQPSISNDSQSPGIGPITFAQDINDSGGLINPSGAFPADTTLVYAQFEYWGMADGQPWGYTMTWDGEEYIEALDEAWEDGREGWVAYYFEDLEPGEYELTLYLEGRAVQLRSFAIGVASSGYEPQEGAAAFGAIEFATGVTDDLIPIRPVDEFEYGITEVYAVFPYFNLSDGTAWAREWLLDGEIDVARELVWDEGTDGMSYAYLVFEDDTIPLDPGTYSLNLYIEGQLARSADFVIYGGEEEPEPEEAQGPAAPEEIIDPNLMPAWELLAYSNAEILRDVAQFALDYHIEMILTDEISAKGTYRCSSETRDPGTLYISLEFWHSASWEEVAATMAHELTHAVQHIEGGRCYCSIENEYYAYVTEFYVLQETGRMDLLESKWRGAYDNSGRFDSGKLWQAVKEAYPECSDY